MTIEYRPLQDLTDTDTVVAVDSIPSGHAVLTLSHWPSTPTPAQYPGDSSADIVTSFLLAGATPPASLMTSDHFDADGLIAMELLRLGTAGTPRARLYADAAFVGDFRALRGDEDALRLSCLVDAWCDPATSPLDPDSFGRARSRHHADLFEALLPRFAELADDLPAHRGLWREQVEFVHRSLDALSAPGVAVEHDPDLDLSVLHLPAGHTGPGDDLYLGWSDIAAQSVGRYATVLVSGGDRHRIVSRYENWVRMAAPRPFLRRDLSPLAERLSRLDSVEWHYDGVQQMTPVLLPLGPSTLSGAVVEEELRAALHALPPAWDPWVPMQLAVH